MIQITQFLLCDAMLAWYMLSSCVCMCMYLCVCHTQVLYQNNKS